MISVSEAKSIILENTSLGEQAILPLVEARGLTLAQDVFAPHDIPNYSQSSMDGYAIRFNSPDKLFKITCEIAAGAERLLTINENEAARIFTGAPLPQGADTVVMQEKTRVTDDLVSIQDDQLVQGANVRPRGSEITEGALALRAGSFLGPGALGFLAGLGIAQVKVFALPKVTLIVTGNELLGPGMPISFGKVYDANSVSIVAALNQAGISAVDVVRAGDDLHGLQSAISAALERSDMVLLSGGVSVGDYDFVVKAANACGVSTKFHRVKQKPGKPLFFGTKDSKLIFGLPGNPSSSLTCFFMYTLPAIEKWGALRNSIQNKKLVLEHDFTKVQGLTQFVKALAGNGRVSIMNAQESFRLYSFAQANSIVELDESLTELHTGDEVKVHLLPGCYEC